MIETNRKTTIIAPVSASVGGSINIIRVSGEKAIEISNQIFVPHDLSQSESGRFFHGHIQIDKANKIDEVVLLIYRAPSSYTGEDVVEINCHANPIIVQSIIRVYLDNQCKLAEPGEFTKRAFINGKMDLTQAEAVADIIASKSKHAIQNSLSVLEGSLKTKLNGIKNSLTNAASLLELDLDFTEEDLGIINPDTIKNELSNVKRDIAYLIKSYDVGKELNRGIEVLITGKPNVGKSSLMNTILGHNRMIVSSVPGTTRDTVHEDIMLNDILVRFIDSAGIRLTEDVVESEGVERARNLFNRASAILLLIDLSEPPSAEDWNLLKMTKSFYPEKTVILGNKCDLPVNKNTAEALSDHAENVINISAKQDKNIEKLKKRLTSQFLSSADQRGEDIFITNERQYRALVSTQEGLDRAGHSLDSKAGNEFVAFDLREAIQHLSEITGEITSDDILNNIFLNFCIGK